jgi:hypothetical protein
MLGLGSWRSRLWVWLWVLSYVFVNLLPLITVSEVVLTNDRR